MSVLERGEPRNVKEKRGAMASRRVEEKVSSQAKCAGERPDDSSSKRE